jgi:hypothetical protein
MIQEAGSMNFTRILSTLKGAKAAARLLLASGKLDQFRLAEAIHQEAPDLENHPGLDDN